MSAAKGRVDLDKTRASLEQLGLMHASEGLSGLLADAVKKNLTAHRLLDELMALELSQREERRIATSLRLSGLPTGQTLGNFDYAFQPAVKKSRIETLATSRARPGSGKPIWRWPWASRRWRTVSRSPFAGSTTCCT